MRLGIERFSLPQDAPQIGHGIVVIGDRPEITLIDDALHMICRPRPDPDYEACAQ